MTHKSKNPSANAGVFQFQMVARGGIVRGLRMSDPSRDQLVNLVVIPNIDWNNLTLSNDEFKSNSVLQINRDAVQPVQFSLKSVQPQRWVVWVYC